MSDNQLYVYMNFCDAKENVRREIARWVRKLPNIYYIGYVITTEEVVIKLNRKMTDDEITSFNETFGMKIIKRELIQTESIDDEIETVVVHTIKGVL